MIFPNIPGKNCLNVKIGDIVKEGDILGEIIDIENPYAPKQEIKCRTNGIIFSIFNLMYKFHKGLHSPED